MTGNPTSWEGDEIICIKELLLSGGLINDCLCPSCRKERERPKTPKEEE